MVLLTSSQVSIAFTSIMICACTAALFFSGYMLQQQTLRDLRAAIKPQLVRVPSQPQRPDLFLSPQLREDGYLVDVLANIPDRRANRDDGGSGGSISGTGDNPGKATDDEEGMVGATRWQKAAKQKAKEVKAAAGGQKPMMDEKAASKRVSDDIANGKTEDTPLGRAERRKKIKEEIMQAGEGESFQGYRRRMW